ncbi:MAG TPA: prepilin-type N-terminal cleavage/methylation domain-containing protein [Symbiobacteriaceae bacterium]
MFVRNHRKGHRPDRRGQEGFTLLEFLVGAFLAGIVVMMMGSILASGQRVQNRVQEQVELQRSGNIALQHLTRQISLAGLNLDLRKGEEAFPPLPPGAGGNWEKALSLRYRSSDGTLQTYSYYLVNGRLMEDLGAGRLRPLTEEGIRVRSLSFRYFTSSNLQLNPANLSQSRWRKQIRRIEIRMELEQTGVSAATPYILETSVTVPNVNQ